MFYSVSAVGEKFLQHFKLQPMKQMSKIQATQTSYEQANRFPFIEVENPPDHHVPAYIKRIQNILRQINSSTTVVQYVKIGKQYDSSKNNLVNSDWPLLLLKIALQLE